MAFEAANDAVASERSIFSKQNHDYNIYIIIYILGSTA